MAHACSIANGPRSRTGNSVSPVIRLVRCQSTEKTRARCKTLNRGSMVEHGPAGAGASLEVRERRPGPGNRRRLVDGVSPGHAGRCVCRRDGRSPAGRPPGVHDRRGSRSPRTSSTPGPDRSTPTSWSPTSFARRERRSCDWCGCSWTIATRPKTSYRRDSSGSPAPRTASRTPPRLPAYLRSIVLNLARDNNRRGLVSLRHHLPFDERSGVGGGRARAPRRPTAGHRCAPRAAIPPA